MYTSTVRKVKATGTRWIDYKLQAMDRLIEKFGLSCVHLNDIISTTTSSKEKATLKGKFNKLADAKLLLCCALFTDILAEAKKICLITQKSDIKIIDIFDLVESTKNNFERLFRKLSKNHNLVFQLPKLVTDAIESNDKDGDALIKIKKLIMISVKKNTYRITSWKWYRLLFPVKQKLQFCTPVKQSEAAVLYLVLR